MNLKTVNNWARKSCPRWNSGFPEFLHKLSRRSNRQKYRNAAIEYYYSTEHQDLVARYKAGEKTLNTYVWPYSEEGFAGWDEDDSEKGYSLISDQSGCVIRYSTSYVAYKIFEETGKWPQKKTSERLDAKRWEQFLAEAGYGKKLMSGRLKNGHHYVGIKPDEGEWGLVVWFEEVEEGSKRYVNVSTYYDRCYFFGPATIEDFIWIQIN